MTDAHLNPPLHRRSLGSICNDRDFLAIILKDVKKLIEINSGTTYHFINLALHNYAFCPVTRTVYIMLYKREKS